jgi:copper chaperone CopZ
MTQKQLFHIPSMHCSGCVMILEGIEDELPGILRVKGSYQKASLEIEWDDQKVSLAEIRSTIQRLGYEVSGS